MRSLEEAQNQFAYHPATEDTAPKHAAIRDLFRDLLPQLWAAIPEGPERTLAVRKLQEAQMYANLAIALTAPADTGPTRAVHRTLEGTVGEVPIRSPLQQGVKCQCTEVVLGPGEKEYTEWDKTHRPHPATCGTPAGTGG